MKVGLVKQDVIIADSTGTSRLTVWQSDVDSLTVGQSYIFNKVTVRSYDGLKYLSPLKLGWLHDECDDIGDVEETNDKNEVKNAVVAGVSYIGSHPSCISCKA